MTPSRQGAVAEVVVFPTARRRIALYTTSITRAERAGIQVILSGVQPQPGEMLSRISPGPSDGRVRHAADFAATLQMARTAVV